MSADTEGSKTTYYLAICLDCEPVIPQPFTKPEDRTEWAGQHAAGVGHRVVLDRETR